MKPATVRSPKWVEPCLAALTFAIFQGGCLPLPFVLPPVSVSAGIGPGGGIMEAAPDLPAQPTGTQLSEEFRFVARPLAAVPALLNRPLDVGIGYKVQRLAAVSSEPDAPASPWLHGPSVELRIFPWRQVSRQTALRLAIVTHVDLLGARPGQPFQASGGGDVGLEFSLSHFLHGSPGAGGDKHAMVAGVAWGEIGIGAALTAGQEVIAGQHFGYGMLSLTMQLPAAIGVALIPLTSLFR
ncbi:MAG TPA: hypothetical protein PKI49_05405 [Pseudomonadota bacterium]|nr:hypothetical protein [Pseudomonadota bacterium]HNI61058.1 hypothetical protein [Pseudomonadota bacterium]HNK46644.1 hypothetical protein [Pseudomonadota bacterium]HNN53735.1 hypothetical protein [Pseudomonadota bacterium]HNO67926.1 hypothetical protein [Pseudomonadota bacterium]